MNKKRVWNDESRDELRETLRLVIRGELRLARNGHEEILEYCRESYIQEEAPEREWGKFSQFAADELQRTARQLSKEQETWPAETDCDRLDRVEIALRERGILLWQASPCCDSCTAGAFPDRIDEINRREPGFGDRIRGYTFFIEQNLADTLADDTDLSVYLAYGWFPPEDTEVAPQDYEKAALGIAREVCEFLSQEGFEPDWDGDFSRKIGVSVNWQRRTMLQ